MGPRGFAGGSGAPAAVVGRLVRRRTGGTGTRAAVLRGDTQSRWLAASERAVAYLLDRALPACRNGAGGLHSPGDLGGPSRRLVVRPEHTGVRQRVATTQIPDAQAAPGGVGRTRTATRSSTALREQGATSQLSSTRSATRPKPTHTNQPRERGL